MLPSRTALPAGAAGFSVLDGAVVITELQYGTVTSDDPREVAAHLELFAALRAQALTDSDALAALVRTSQETGDR